MSKLGEDEADAFFHEGDSGTYDGGPVSLAPVGMADLIEDVEDPHAHLPSAEQLARRERFKRLVTRGMTTLAACSAFLFAFRATRMESTTARAAANVSPSTEQTRSSVLPVAAAAPGPAAARPAPVAEAPASEARAIDAPKAALVAPIAEAPASEAPVVDAPKVAPEAPVAKAVAVGAPSRPPEHGSVSPTTRQSAGSNPARVAERTPRREREAVSPAAIAPISQPSLVMMTTRTRSATASGHAPPTATFPD